MIFIFKVKTCIQNHLSRSQGRPPTSSCLAHQAMLNFPSRRTRDSSCIGQCEYLTIFVLMMFRDISNRKIYDVRTNLYKNGFSKVDLMGKGNKMNFASKENYPGPFQYKVLGEFDKIGMRKNRGISFKLSRNVHSLTN